MAKSLLKRFSQSTVVSVANYKSIFARPRQHFQTQKQSSNLILAVKKENHLYPGSGQVQGFGLENFFYNTLTLNCVYNCDYCYLQGMYPSANQVVFVNSIDFLDAARSAISARTNKAQPLYLCISYDTDLLAFENVVPYCREWITFASEQTDLLLEIRTKSASYRSISDLPVTDRVILAWTLSPEIVASKYERGAPPVHRRLESAASAAKKGWPVRLCFDPVITVPDWKSHYQKLIETTFDAIPCRSVRDATVGVFRMNAHYLDRIRKQRQNSDILYSRYEKEGENVSYSKEQRPEITSYIRDLLTRHLPPERIEVWT
jgi:spore photoproduct lyase